MKSLWLYAIVDSAPRRRLGTGLSGEPLRLVAAARGRPIAVAGECAPPRLTERTVLGHARVVRRLARVTDSILPARFGTALDPARIAKALGDRAEPLLEALALVRGREQMTVRLYGAAARAPARPPRAKGAGPGARYLSQRSQAAREGWEAALAALQRAVGSLVRAERVVPHPDPDLVASVYHLIDRGRASAYRARLRRARLDADASGPWAPFAFAPEPW